MNPLASNMWAGMGTLEEIGRGTFNRFLTLPVSRSAIMNANVVEQAGQHHVPVGGHRAAGRAGRCQLPRRARRPRDVGRRSGAAGHHLRCPVQHDRHVVRLRESIIGINTFLLLPLTFLSTVFMAKDLMPGWMQGIAAINPLDWAVQAGRSALSASQEWGVIGSRGGWLLALAVDAVALSTRTFRSYQKAV